ncbi:MAG: PPOX class F420-dependent oxidoreductase [Chloroflexia bacterium]
MTTQASNQASPIPDSYKDLLRSTAVANVATIGPHGEPQVNPVWFDWDGETLLFSQTKTRQKIKNIAREPRVAISIVDPANPYRYLEIRGVVVEVVDDSNNKFINSMAKKYMDQDVYPWNQPNDERVVVKVRPERTTQMG